MPFLWWPTIRSVVFGSLIVANAITTSAGVWHLSISDYGGQVFSLDIYVIMISALALLGVSAIVFFELALPEPRLCRLWFETTWAAILFLTEFAAAVAVSALGSNVMCSRITVIETLDSCVANKLLLAFLWISTVIALLYTLTLLFFVIRARGKNFNTWRSIVRNLHWSGPVDCLPSVPASPSRPKFQSSLIVAPQPRPARRPLDAFRSGLGSEYEIEHYQPPPLSLPVLGLSNPSDQDPPASFYADHLRPKLSHATAPLEPSVPTPVPSPPPPIAPGPEPSQVREERKSIRPLPQFPPPPLGDWPRSDAMARESSKKRGKRREILPPESDLEPSPLHVPPPEPEPEPALPPPQLVAAAPVALTTTTSRGPPPVSMSSSPLRSKPLGPRLSGERRISGDMPWK